MEGDAAVYDVAAEEVGSLTGDFGVVGPLRLAGLRVKGENNAPGAGRVDDAIFRDRRGFEAPCSAEFLAPHQAEFRDGLLVDLVERAEALIGLRTAMQAPALVGRSQRQETRTDRNKLLPH